MGSQTNNPRVVTFQAHVFTPHMRRVMVATLSVTFALAILALQGASSFRLGLTHKPLSPQLDPLKMLQVLEMHTSEQWNRTGSTLLVLGQKARRDFGVYAWAFGYHHFKLLMPPLGIVLLTDISSMQNMGGLLCHSLFLSNCVRRGPTPTAIAHAGDAELIYGHVRGRKINRLAGVRQVLSTKDGLCVTLRASHLSASDLWKFTFPCWVLPKESDLLLRYLERQDATDGQVTAGTISASAPSVAAGAASTWPAAWIVKPAHGSQGQGIHVYNTSEELRDRLRAPEFMRSLRTPLVVQPYLRMPRLHQGRKWDVRTYVLATAALPMRLYLFSEAIVRYSSSVYSPSATHDIGAVLTNTYVGKRLLNQGVGAITGSLADLCTAAPAGGAAHQQRRWTVGDGGASFGCDDLARAMTRAIGGAFLAAEPRLRSLYASDYTRMHAADAVDGLDGLGGVDAFRCSQCYHLFGVDLIADAAGGMHVIEVNVEPDLTLSTEGGCARDGSNCTGGSKAYDHTKRAAAFNTVRLVYSRAGQAQRLQRLLARNAARIATLPLMLISPQSQLSPSAEVLASAAARANGAFAAPPTPVLRAEVAEYVLDWMREAEASGCFMPVYPSSRHHALHAAQLRRMRSDPYRLQMHELLGILLEDFANGSAARGTTGATAAAAADSFRSRCEQMLHDVPHVPQGAWARRTHIFKEVWDL